MLAYEVKKSEEEVTITFNTDMVGSQMDGLKEDIRNAINKGYKFINVDVSHVNVMDSSAIGLLVVTQNTLEKMDGALKIFNVSPNLLDLFSSMRLDTRFHISN